MEIIKNYDTERIEKLLLHKKVQVDYENDTLILENGLVLEIVDNRYLYHITELNQYDNRIIDVAHERNWDTYQIFILCEGTIYKLKVKIK